MKHSNPRIINVSQRLIDMLNRLPRTDEKVFGNTLPEEAQTSLLKQRRRVATKLQNPRILEIHFHTLRHWKATMLYHQTKDILYVMNFLGHKNIKNTLIYIQLAEAIFKENNDQFTCRAASNVEEAASLIEAGFDYVTTFNGVMLFRKRK